jgi:hypothetical protein|tara:strand:+ start:645 stop:872 length:228 start_codon:yes stop_codon:yes gene_type:complete
MNIENLKPHQVKLLDKMWSIQTKEDLDTWMAGLNETDLNAVIVLRQLMIYEFIDVATSIMKSEDFVSVNKLLSKF